MRSLSNLIKAGYVNYDGKDKVVIDSDGRMGSFRPLTPARVAEIPHEEEEEDPVQVFDSCQAEEEAGEILEKAEEEASRIKEAAMAEAEEIKTRAMEEGRQDGYEAGLAAAGEELLRQESALNERAEANQREFEEQLNSLEPVFVDIMISYIEKITGVLLEDKRDVILHLVSKAIRKIGRSKNFHIRVGAEDYSFLDAARDKLYEAAGEEAVIDILEDKSMEKNQCIIEADDRIIDCSLDVQLKGLIDDLKLLARI